jgi:hypothetical protein
MYSDKKNRILKFEIILDSLPDKTQIKIRVDIKPNKVLYKCIINLGETNNDYWSIMDFVNYKFKDDFIIIDSQSQLNIITRWTNIGYKKCEIVLTKDSIQGDDHVFTKIRTFAFDLNFSSFIKDSINLLTKKLIRKYLVVIMVGIVQWLDKYQIPREITTMIFRYCDIPIRYIPRI